ncbi:polyadenylate-binding protein 1-B-like [Oppia nitens]|uniref:polyadenylate-binding protein 1-B-like n=1 Tax=Oppia nitens TaxID=1686743 RepID=UPI0023DA54B9|nr:polyadenylate-binding protein 1-B-like [Oppia nitens]
MNPSYDPMMQSLNERKRLEMEAEMNRFELEISARQQVYDGGHHHHQQQQQHPHHHHHQQHPHPHHHQQQQHHHQQQQQQQHHPHHQPMPSAAGGGGPANFQFIPHSIQRQLPRSGTLPPLPHHQINPMHMSYESQTNSMNQMKNDYHHQQQQLNSGMSTPNTGGGGGPSSGQTGNSGAASSSSAAGTSKKSKTSSTAEGGKGGKKQKKLLRMAGGTVWEDNSLAEWDTEDFRLFCGDLGNDVTDDVLTRAFSRFSSFQKAKVIRDKRSNKSRGYGFVSFKDPQDFIRAIKEMNGKYVGSRPIKLRKSEWKERSYDVVKKKLKNKVKMGYI